jgi:arabinogalactan endo-1,4-beta-galactosidase
VKSDSGTVVSYARYYDYLTDEGKSYFMVNTNYEPFVLGRMEFEKQSLSFVSASPNRAVVAIDVTVTYTPEGGETVVQRHSALEMELVYEGGTWKLDTPPYMNYDPEWK